MSIFRFFNKQASAPKARERLQILLAHERASQGHSELVLKLRKKFWLSLPSTYKSTEKKFA